MREWSLWPASAFSQLAAYPVSGLLYLGSGWEGRLGLERGHLEGLIALSMSCHGWAWEGTPIAFQKLGVGCELRPPPGFRSV